MKAAEAPVAKQTVSAFALPNYERFLFVAIAVLDHLHKQFPVPAEVTLANVGVRSIRRPDPNDYHLPDFPVALKSARARVAAIRALEKGGTSHEDLLGGALENGVLNEEKFRTWYDKEEEMRSNRYQEALALYRMWSDEQNPEFLLATLKWLVDEKFLRRVEGIQDEYVLTSTGFARGFRDGKKWLTEDLAVGSDVKNPTLWDEVKRALDKVRKDPVGEASAALPHLTKLAVGFLAPGVNL